MLPRHRLVLAVVVLLCVAVVAGLTLGPLPSGGLDLFTSGVQRAAAVVGLPEPTRAEAEALANVLLFLPLGAAGALLARIRWVIPTLVLASVGVELVQAVLPDRTPSLRDVLLNAAGATVGALLALALRYCIRIVRTPAPPTVS